MKRILYLFSVLGLTISILASNLPANSQSNQSTENTRNSGNIAASDTHVFENPTEGSNIPIDAAIKGADGRDSNARQQGANAFCQTKGYNQAVNFEYKRGSTIGTMQWDKKNEVWVFCEKCGIYLTEVTCK